MEKVLNASREKHQVTCRNRPIRTAVDFSTETPRPGEHKMMYFRLRKHILSSLDCYIINKAIL